MSDLVCLPRELIVRVAKGEAPASAIVFAAAQAAFPGQEESKISAKFDCQDGVEVGRRYVVKGPPPRQGGANYAGNTNAGSVPGPFAAWLRDEFLRRFSSEYPIGRPKMDIIWPILAEAEDPKAAAEILMKVMEDVDKNQQEIKSPGAFAAGMLQKQGLRGLYQNWERIQQEGTAVSQSPARQQDRARQAAEAELAKRTAPVLDPAYSSSGVLNEDEDEYAEYD